MVIFGIVYHAIGGFAAGSFYLPLKKVKQWSWESAWFVNGIFSWILAPIIVAVITVPSLISVITRAPVSGLFWTYFFWVLWGIRHNLDDSMPYFDLTSCSVTHTCAGSESDQQLDQSNVVAEYEIARRTPNLGAGTCSRRNDQY